MSAKRKGSPPRSRFQLYRDAKRGGPPAPPAPHGTMGAVRRHERAHEKLCGKCRAAANAAARARYEARKAKGSVAS